MAYNAAAVRRWLLTGAAIACLWLAGASAAAGGVSSTFVRASVVGTYIANYGARAKACTDLVTPIWVSWLSYAEATVSDQWRVYASSKKLCTLARATAYAAIDRTQYGDGAGQTLSVMIDYAMHHHYASLEAAPKPAGKSWACGILPAYWGQNAYDLAAIDGHGSPTEDDFAAAAGPAAGAGYCEKGAKHNSQAQWTGGKFISWAPDTTTCKVAYKLKTIPDPDNPEDVTNPPFPADLWSDYDKRACS